MRLSVGPIGLFLDPRHLTIGRETAGIAGHPPEQGLASATVAGLVCVCLVAITHGLTSMCSTRNPGCSRPFWASRTPRPIGAPDAPAGYEPKAGTFRHPLHPLVSVIPALLDYAVAGRPAPSAVHPPRWAARGALARRAHRRPRSPRGRQRPHSSGRRTAFTRIEVLLPEDRGRPGAMSAPAGSPR